MVAFIATFLTPENLLFQLIKDIVYIVEIIYLRFEEVLDHNVSLVAVGQGVSGTREQILCFCKGQSQCEGERNTGILRRFVVPVRHDF